MNIAKGVVLGTMFGLLLSLLTLSHPAMASGCENGEGNLIENGCFETPDIPEDTWDIFDSSQLPGWTIEWTNSEDACGGDGADPVLELQDNLKVNAFEGSQYAELDSDCGGPDDNATPDVQTNVNIWQEIDTTPDTQYEISFAIIRRSDDPDSSQEGQKLTVRWDGQEQDTFVATNTWQQHTLTVTASGSSTRVEFADTGTPNAFGLFLDDVRVVPLLPAQDNDGTLEVVKTLIPDTDSGRFDLQIDGETLTEGPVGDGGSTGQHTLNTGTHTIGEIAGPETDLSDYEVSVECANSATEENFTPSPPTDDSHTWELTINDGDDITCFITNELSEEPPPPEEAVCASDAAGNLVENGCFETPVVTASRGWDLYTSAEIPGWSVAWVVEGTCGGAGANIELQRSGQINDVVSPEGDQHAELDSGCKPDSAGTNTVNISQSLDTLSGTTYQISFWMRARPGDHGAQTLTVRWNGADLATDLPAPADWTQYSYTAQATGPTATIEFIDTGLPNSFGVLLDDVQVIPAADADLSISKIDATDPVITGDTINYTITVTNSAGSDVAAENVVISDTVPAGLIFDSASTEVCSQSGGVVTCELGTLDVGSTQSVTIALTTTTAGVSPIINTAEVSSTTPDPNPANNNATAETTINPKADLSVTKTASATPVTTGDVFSYTIVVTNNGPDTATGVFVSDPLPEEITPDSVQGDNCVDVEGTVECSPANISSGDSVTITIVATATTPAESVINTVNVSAGPVDPIEENNTASAEISIEAPLTEADLSLTKTVNYNTPAPGAPITFTLTISNAGPDEATNVAVSDPLPSAFTYDSSTASQGSYDDSTGVWTVGTLPNGFTATLDIQVTAPNQGTLTNIAEVLAVDQTDPDSTPNNGLDEDDLAGVSIKVDSCNNIAWPLGADPEDCTEDQPLAALNSGKSNMGLASPLQQDFDPSADPDVTFIQTLDQEGQDRWYKFPVTPQSLVFVTLTGPEVEGEITPLPANYDLTLYTDIYDAFVKFQEFDDTDALLEYGVEVAPTAFAPSSFSPSSFSPSSFSPSSFSPSSFSPSSFSPSSFSPSSFSPSSFSPSSFSPSSFSPSSFSPSSFSPSSFSPSSFSPSSFSPSSFSPSSFSPSSFSPSSFSPSSFSPSSFSPSSFSSFETFEQAFSGAQVRSLIGVSAFDGTSPEGLVLNSWLNDGDFYVRVRGRNGAFDPDNPYQLTIKVFAGSCESVQPISTPSNLAQDAHNGGYKTLILSDIGRMQGTPAEKQELWDRLNEFANRPEIQGQVLNVGSQFDRINGVSLPFLPEGDSRVIDLNNQADGNVACPYGKNLVADSIKNIIDSYWFNDDGSTKNPLEYIVIIGDDDDIPFYRHPDQSQLGSETNYIPPVIDASHSQSSLRLGYVLGQDRYGSQIEIAAKDHTLPYPDLAVGRLVESAQDVMGMLDAYDLTSNGVLDQPQTALTTGYDFLEDATLAIKEELEKGTSSEPGLTVNGDLIDPFDQAPELGWTADELRARLLNNRYDLMFLAGHFSAQSALAADFETSLISTELLQPGVVDMTNAIVYSAGCHSGYNLVNDHDIFGIPDWAQTFAQKGATLFAGTGYQYGDTDFIEYSERLYLELTRFLRATGPDPDGGGPIPIGKAWVNAKKAYLGQSASDRGIYEKAYLEATLFGLPMLQIDMPGLREDPPVESPNVNNITAATDIPGSVLGLYTADLTINSPVNPSNGIEKELRRTDNPSQTVTATYWEGNDGILTNPVEPVLPLEVENVDINMGNLVLRGVGFEGGTFSDVPDILPLTGAPTTEIRGVHPPFFSNYFFPVRPWNINYYAALGGGETRLMVTPAQFKSNTGDPSFGTMRLFDQMKFRLYYSDNLSPTVAASGAPTIVNVQSQVDNGGQVNIRARVVGNPLAGIHEVWVTYVDFSNSNEWKSFNLVQSPTDSTVWRGVLPTGSPCDVQFMVQAVNGVGLVNLDTNFGRYHKVAAPGCDPVQAQETALNLQLPSPATGVYGSTASFEATLTRSDTGAGLANQQVIFNIGSISRLGTTDSTGKATVDVTLLGLPNDYDVRASFLGTDGFEPSSDTGEFRIQKANTQICLELPANAKDDSCTPVAGTVVGQASEKILMVATLTDQNGNPLDERKTLFFKLEETSSGNVSVLPVQTDPAGRAILGKLNVPPGLYNVTALFNGIITIPDPNGGSPITTELTDDRYNASVSNTGQLELTAPLSDQGQYAVLGLNSVWLRMQSSVHTGSVGANNSSNRWLFRRNEVVVGRYATVGDEDPHAFVAGDSILLRRGSTVNDLFYNNLHQERRVTILGDQTSPLELPLISNLPSSPITPGTENIVVNRGETRRLDGGYYNRITVRKDGTLILTGKTYHINDLNVGRNGQVIATRQNTRVNIANRLKSSTNATLGTRPELTARDLVFYVDGQDGRHGHVWGYPKAVFIGPRNTVKANIYAPNGTVWLRHKTSARGAFIGKHVRIGRRVDVWLESAFSSNPGL